MEYAGSHNGEATYEVTLASAGRADLHGAVMANPGPARWRSSLDGQRHVAKLTLGALAELEAALEPGRCWIWSSGSRAAGSRGATCWR
jgi:hypothetical protein